MSLVSRIPPRSRLLLAFIACGTLAACGSDSLSPFQPEISNPADNFQLQATNVSNVTTTKTYSWANSGTRATINHSTTTTGQPGTWSIQLTLTGYSGTLNVRAQKL